MPQVQAAATAHPTPPAQPVNKRGRIPLMVQFTVFMILTIGLIMSLTTWLTYRQQQKSLREEVVKRGVTIIRNLASATTSTVEPFSQLDSTELVYEVMRGAKIPKSQSFTFSSIVKSLLEDITGGETDLIKREISGNAGVVEIVFVKDKIIIAHANVKMLDKVYHPPKGVNRLKTGEELLVQDYSTQSGEKRIYFSTQVYVKSGSDRKRILGEIHLGMSQELVEQTVKLAAAKLLFATGVIMLLGALVAILLAGYLTQPVKNLVAGVLAIAGGDLNQQLRVSRKDELGELTAAFNEMAASLREKELIKGAFSTYMSSQVMEEVLKDPGRIALGGARKRATMIFADIRGFTAMSETMQPEDVVSIINVYLSVQTEIIVRNGGMLDKFIGDCIMSVFGIPLPKEDDALRAVRSALEIQQAVGELNRARKIAGERTVTIGIGVNTGDVVSGNMGSAQKMDYTVIGDSVNLAARLESVAEGSSILISEETYQLVKDYVIAERLSPLAVKGKKERVSVYRLKSLKA